VNGVYFGLILKADKKNFVTLDLPIDYCCTRFKNAQGLDLIEFNLGYFDSFSKDELKKEALKCYPSYIRKAYNAYSKGRGDQWVFLPAEFSICFPMLNNGIPPLLNIIRASINYEDSVELEKKRDIEEIKKILVQKIPHNNQNELLFEPDEAEVMHAGATNMLKGNENNATERASISEDIKDVNAFCENLSKSMDEIGEFLNDMTRNNDEVVSREIIDPFLFGEDKAKALEDLLKEKAYLKEQLAITRRKNKEKEKEMREIEEEKQEYIRIKQREIDELLKQKVEARKEMMRRARIKKEQAIIEQESKAVKKVRDRKYVVQNRIKEMLSRIRICNSNIEKSGGTIIMLKQEIQNKINVEENKKEIEDIKKNQIKWKETIEKCKKKIKVYEVKIAEIEKKVEDINKVNKVKREKRKKILLEKNSR
jgi:hypothetical protein